MSDSSVFYRSCLLCPRRCNANRNSGKLGFCAETSELKLAWAGLHFGEEPFITAAGGSGTIFVTGCNLKCAFCQNYQISQKGTGAAVGQELFIRICLALQEAGAENINIVTGSHAIASLAPFLRCAKSSGLKIPVCWNCSAYESIEALELLSDVVDIWLPDLKTLNPLISEAVFAAKDYPQVAKRAIKWMIEHSEPEFTTVFDKQGKKHQKMLSGVIVRHLALPGRIEDSALVLDWFEKHADKRAYLSLMSQYTPVPFSQEEMQQRQKALSAFQNRYIEKDEFDKLQQLIESYEIENGFYQELVQDTEWLPDFNRVQPFSSELARPIWHWSNPSEIIR